MTDNIILTIIETNWGMICYPDDDWLSTTWEIEKNGVVQRKIQRTLSGELFDGLSTISKENFDILLEKLKEFETQTKNYKCDACDGTGYTFTVYENGEEKYKYSGYIYGSDYLNSILTIVKEHH